MKLRILAFGIARDILGASTIELETPDGISIQSLKVLLIEKYPDFAKLAAFAIAVNEAYESDDYVLSVADEVVIIPPVSGG